MKSPAEQFSSDEVKCGQLRALIENPVLQEALQILKDEIEPHAADAEALRNATLAMSQRSLVAGANHIIKGLRRLLQPGAAQKPLSDYPRLLSEAEYRQKFAKELENQEK